MRIYITGINGLLGYSSQRILKENYEVFGCDITKSNYSLVDITDSDKLTEDINKINPDIIIHTVSMIGVEACEKNKAKAKKINVQGTKNVVNICRENNIELIHISTPCVFNNDKTEWKEDDKPCPMTFYGETKAEQECIIQDSLKDYLIIRTNFFGWNHLNKIGFAEWLMDEILFGNKVKMWNDVFFNQIFTDDLANIVDKMIMKKLNGIYHVSSNERLNKYYFAMSLAKCFGYSNKNIISSKLSNDFHNQQKELYLNVDKINNEISMPYLYDCLQNFKRNRGFYK